MPLAETWDSGGKGWSQVRRVAYANHLNDLRHLVAVTSRSNRSKADKDPAERVPPAADATCRYTADWIMELTWALSIGPRRTRRPLAARRRPAPTRTSPCIPAP